MSVRRLLVPVILPAACSWVSKQERMILQRGIPLDQRQLADARKLGVKFPERIRVLHVQSVPLPANWLTKATSLMTGRYTSGLAAQYGIFIRAQFAADRRLLAHELTHTHQYERLGGIRPFLRQYLRECLTDGYAFAGLEIEARDRAETLCTD